MIPRSVVPRAACIATLIVASGLLSQAQVQPPTNETPPLPSDEFFNSNIVRRLMTAATAAPVTRFTSEQIFNYAVSPDQKRLAVVRGRLSSDVVLVSTADKQDSQR